MKLLRKVLKREQDIEALLESKCMVIILKAPDLQAQLLDHVELWETMKPEVTEDMKKNKEWPTHPLGEKCVYLHMMMTDLLKGVFNDDAPVKEAIEKLEAVSKEEIRRIVTSLKPKYKKPKEGRAWVWQLVMSDFTSPEYKSHWACLLGKSSKAVHIDMHRNKQDQLTKDLWEELKKRMPSRA